MVFQMSYDQYPLDTRAWKRTWLPRIAADRGVSFADLPLEGKESLWQEAKGRMRGTGKCRQDAGDYGP